MLEVVPEKADYDQETPESTYQRVEILISHGRDSRPRLSLDIARMQKTKLELDNGYLHYIHTST